VTGACCINVIFGMNVCDWQIQLYAELFHMLHGAIHFFHCERITKRMSSIFSNLKLIDCC